MPIIQHTDLTSVALIDNWNVYTCKHCKTTTYAQATDSTKYLLNMSLLVSKAQHRIAFEFRCIDYELAPMPDSLSADEPGEDQQSEEQ